MSDDAAAKKPRPAALTRQLTSHLDKFVKGDAAAAAAMAEAGLEAGHAEGAHVGATLRLLYGEDTDIGGGQVNQDKYDVFRCGDKQENLVMAVFDGHGRELGEMAAIIARDKVRSLLQQESVMERVSEDPTTALTEVFKQAHIEIKDRFLEKYQQLNWQVQETSEGYLVKRRGTGSTWTCTHGGTTGTVVIVFGGSNRMIVANVGDSTALWGGVDTDNNVLYQELSAEHSPESEAEFRRVRDFRSDQSGVMPEMHFVYDSPSYSKSQCPPVFQVDAKDPDRISISNMGNYYKNVRNEWATLVTTPTHARFQDALAFTRSLGDLHLHVYGVSCVPEVMDFNLQELHDNGSAGNPHQASVLLVCTDGVWDNWKYHDAVREALKPAMLQGVVDEGNGKRATVAFMEENKRLGNAHFGDSADNASGILCYIFPVDAAARQE